MAIARGSGVTPKCAFPIIRNPLVHFHLGEHGWYRWEWRRLVWYFRT